MGTDVPKACPMLKKKYSHGIFFGIGFVSDIFSPPRNCSEIKRTVFCYRLSFVFNSSNLSSAIFENSAQAVFHTSGLEKVHFLSFTTSSVLQRNSPEIMQRPFEDSCCREQYRYKSSYAPKASVRSRTFPSTHHRSPDTSSLCSTKATRYKAYGQEEQAEFSAPPPYTKLLIIAFMSAFSAGSHPVCRYGMYGIRLYAGVLQNKSVFCVDKEQWARLSREVMLRNSLKRLICLVSVQVTRFRAVLPVEGIEICEIAASC